MKRCQGLQRRWPRSEVLPAETEVQAERLRCQGLQLRYPRSEVLQAETEVQAERCRGLEHCLPRSEVLPTDLAEGDVAEEHGEIQA